LSVTDASEELGEGIEITFEETDDITEDTEDGDGEGEETETENTGAARIVTGTNRDNS
jgi:hypothetical protein